MLDYIAIKNKEREDFVRNRTVQEQQLNNWYNEIKKCPQEFLDKIPAEYGELTLPNLVPELYQEKPDKNVVHQQYETAKQKLDTVNKLIEAWNNEAIKLNNEFNTI